MAPPVQTDTNTIDYTQAVHDGIVVLKNGVRVINSSPHPFVFDDGTTVPSCGISLNCDFVETETNPKDIFSNITLVLVDKTPRAEGIAFLNVVPIDVLVLGSAHAAEAYGFPVVMPVPTPDSKRGSFADRKVCSARFTRTTTYLERGVSLDDL